MLWDLIRDFFVQHVFGGLDSNGYSHQLSGGTFDHYISGVYEEGLPLNDVIFKVSTIGNDTYAINMCDWLSTTATAISITIIVVLCCMFVYKIIKLIGGLIR